MTSNFWRAITRHEVRKKRSIVHNMQSNSRRPDKLRFSFLQIFQTADQIDSLKVFFPEYPSVV